MISIMFTLVFNYTVDQAELQRKAQTICQVMDYPRAQIVDIESESRIIALTFMCTK